jgi:hypothetical protein
MFYYLIHKFELVKHNSHNRFFKIFLIGTFCYVFIHTLINSKKMEGFADNYKKYLYYLWLSDLAFTLALIKLFSPKIKEEENDFDDVSETKEDNNEEMFDLEKNISPELLKMLQYQKELENNNIFIKKNEVLNNINKGSSSQTIPNQSSILINQDNKPEIKQDNKSEVKQDNKLEVKPEVKPEVKQEVKPDEKILVSSDESDTDIESFKK